MAETKSSSPLANPAVVGLAGFAMTTFILQMINLGWCGLGPVIALGLVYGGGAQLIAGYMEFKTGNNFGFSAFCSYGAFWIALCVIFLLNHFGIYKSSETDIGWFLVGWTIFTGILWIASMRIHTAMAITFTTLLIGFILLDFVFFGHPGVKPLAAWILIVCALTAWYMMAHAIFLQVFGVDVLPVGRPWIQPSEERVQLAQSQS